MNGTSRPSNLSLVPRNPQPRRRYDTRIIVSSPRLPIGRSRTFRLTESDIEMLVEAAMRLESRLA